MTTNLRTHDLTPALTPIDDLRPLGRDTRKHPAHQLARLARNLETFGFVTPVVIDAHHRVVAGWALVQAAQRLLLTHIPTVTVTGLSDVQLRALRLALNRLSEDASWNPNELRLEIGEIINLDSSFDLTLTGFEMGEIDLSLGDDAVEPTECPPDPPDRQYPAVSQVGDLWELDRHRLLCGDALEPESYANLLTGQKARTVFTDPPYNVPIQGHVSGKGRIVHAEFAMASGEMTDAEFIAFLRSAMTLMVAHSVDGALHFLCMDWRHLYQLQSAGRDLYSELKNLCVWNKSNAGMGSFYRSKHELVAVYKSGKAKHINNVELGRYGRNRSNVWDYPGVNTFRPGRMDDLAAHPTVKPLALVADAILDASNRGDVVLDPFLGSGTTLLACEQTGRIGHAMELDPYYVDVAIRRWQTMTGEPARHSATRESFDDRATAAQNTSINSNCNAEVNDELR